jgi:hypothetical protein
LLDPVYSIPKTMTMNALLNGLDELYDAVKTIENDDCATRIRRFLIELLHKEEVNLPHNNPNHPYSRFAEHDDAEGNHARLFHAMQECVDETNEDLQAAVNMMFETPGTLPYDAAQTLLRRYMRYANEHRSSNSDSDSDSDLD